MLNKQLYSHEFIAREGLVLELLGGSVRPISIHAPVSMF